MLRYLGLVPTITQSCGVSDDQSSVGSQAVVLGALVAPVQSSPDEDKKTYKCDSPFTTKDRCDRI